MDVSGFLKDPAIKQDVVSAELWPPPPPRRKAAPAKPSPATRRQAAATNSPPARGCPNNTLYLPLTAARRGWQVRLIAQYLQEEGFDATTTILQDEANIKLLEKRSEIAQFKRYAAAMHMPVNMPHPPSQ